VEVGCGINEKIAEGVIRRQEEAFALLPPTKSLPALPAKQITDYEKRARELLPARTEKRSFESSLSFRFSEKLFSVLIAYEFLHTRRTASEASNNIMRFHLDSVAFFQEPLSLCSKQNTFLDPKSIRRVLEAGLHGSKAAAEGHVEASRLLMQD